jgi:hypothetical protein
VPLGVTHLFAFEFLPLPIAVCGVLPLWRFGARTAGELGLGTEPCNNEAPRHAAIAWVPDGTFMSRITGLSTAIQIMHNRLQP